MVSCWLNFNNCFVMADGRRGIPPEDFYGKKYGTQERIEAILKKQEVITPKPATPRFMNQLLGPSKTWKVFKKQQEAIDCCLTRRNGLMAFAFEDVNGRRMFLAAHPKVFWFFNSNRFFKNCNTYEIIREYSACKLYLDIEYEYQYNKDSNGERMLSNIIDIINFSILSMFGIRCTREDILDLDSSSSYKFSRHIIYQIKDVSFQDNYSVGNFVKHICNELTEAYKNNEMNDTAKLKEVSERYVLSEKDILELFVKDHKNKTKLFLDEGVYTKNRHFRLWGSSKQTKNIPLVVSKVNKYKLSECRDSYDCSMFLDSLVTYFCWKVNKILEFGNIQTVKGKPVERREKQSTGTIDCNLYPQIDSFINKLVSPKGWIRRKIFFSDSSTIVYDIQGYRYCDNIKREHRSNNIKIVVDLQSLMFYQKCYDPDCSEFRSDAKLLPDEIQFLFENDDLFMGNTEQLSEFSGLCDDDNDFIEAIKRLENGNDFEMDESIGDDELGMVVDCAEAMIGINL